MNITKTDPNQSEPIVKIFEKFVRKALKLADEIRILDFTVTVSTANSIKIDACMYVSDPIVAFSVAQEEKPTVPVKLPAKRKNVARSLVAKVPNQPPTPKKEVLTPLMKKANRLEVNRQYTLEDDDIKLMRMHLHTWKSLRKLTTEQAQALSSTEGVRLSSLIDVQREQIRNIFHDVREKTTGKRA